MDIPNPLFSKRAFAAALTIALPMTASAAATNDELEAELELLRNQVSALSSEMQQATEWKSPNTLVHLAGYADVGYVKTEGEDGSFVIGSLSPIFHFQYRDIVMLESELEIEIEEDGATEINLEYLTIDWFVSDYATLLAGKFLSPIGQFRQNLHPSWINKLPSAPPGFGHDGAAPVSELGLQFRGGVPLGSMRGNYAVYVANGPELHSVTEDGAEFEIEGVEAEALNVDSDGEKVVGGRFAILPIPAIEVGVSAATGKATVTEVENESSPPAGPPSGSITDETPRDYTVVGADFVWFTGNMSLRGEYVKTDIGEATAGATAGEGAVWETWYTQLAYRIPNTKVEGVIRYTDFDSAHASEDQKQTAVGINYLITNNFIAKLAYESNSNDLGSPADDDRTLVQLAYGF